MDKFPEVTDFEGGDVTPIGDLESRERALLGESGAAELRGTSDEHAANSDAEFDDFSAGGELTPAVSGTASAEVSTAPSVVSDDENSAYVTGTPRGPEAFVPTTVDPSQSEFLKEWRVKKDLEIERRDKVNEEKREETREKARKAIDDFYENYNSKKEDALAKVHKDEEAFLKKRDEDIAGGSQTTWDRISALIEGTGRPAEGIVAVDKHRFKELVESLKGDRNAPGAAGY